MDTRLLAIIADRLGTVIWMLSEDGSTGKNRPPSILAALTGETAAETAEGYDTADDFLAAWAAIGGETHAGTG